MDNDDNKIELFRRMFCEHYPRLVRLAVQLTGDEDDGRDVVSDVMETAWRNFGGIDPARYGTWLRTCVCNACLNRLKHRDVESRHAALIAESCRTATGACRPIWGWSLWRRCGAASTGCRATGAPGPSAPSRSRSRGGSARTPTRSATGRRTTPRPPGRCRPRTRRAPTSGAPRGRPCRPWRLRRRSSPRPTAPPDRSPRPLRPTWAPGRRRQSRPGL